MVDKNRSIYFKVLCEKCKDRSLDEFCKGCKKKYNCAKSAKGYRNKGKKVTKGQSSSIDSVINLERPIETNQPKPQNFGNNGSTSVNDSMVIHSVDSSSDDTNNDRVSIYADLFCESCKKNPIKIFALIAS